jgi:hypothetical protein
MQYIEREKGFETASTTGRSLTRFPLFPVGSTRDGDGAYRLMTGSYTALGNWWATGSRIDHLDPMRF